MSLCFEVSAPRDLSPPETEITSALDKKRKHLSSLDGSSYIDPDAIGYGATSSLNPSIAGFISNSPRKSPLDLQTNTVESVNSVRSRRDSMKPARKKPRLEFQGTVYILYTARCRSSTASIAFPEDDIAIINNALESLVNNNGEGWLSDPATICDLPFPSSTYKSPITFKIFREPPHDAIRRFKFMGREAIKSTHQAVERAQEHIRHADNGSGIIHLYGPLGAGKAHVLAALSCLLAQESRNVLYLPNCSELGTDPVGVMKGSLSFAFPSDQEDISQIKNGDIEALGDYLTSIEPGALICIANQLDELYPGGMGFKSGAELRVQSMLTTLFGKHALLYTSYSVTSLPVTLQSESADQLISMVGGLSKVCLGYRN